MTEEKKTVDVSGRRMRPALRTGQGQLFGGSRWTDGGVFLGENPRIQRTSLPTPHFIESPSDDFWWHGTDPVNSRFEPGSAIENVMLEEGIKRIGEGLETGIEIVRCGGPTEVERLAIEKIMRLGDVSSQSVHHLLIFPNRLRFPYTGVLNNMSSLRQTSAVFTSRMQHHAYRRAEMFHAGAGVMDTNSINALPGSDMDRHAGLSNFLSMCNVNWWALIDDTLFVSPPPRNTVRTSFSERFHNTSGPVIEYRDNTMEYAIDGVFMSPQAHYLYNHPDFINLESILDPEITNNEEVRRLLVQRRGSDDLLTVEDLENYATLISTDEFGKLYEIVMSGGSSLQRAIRVVLVENYTPEPDGTRRQYLLTVPREMETPKQGVAWTYGFRDLDSFTVHQSA